MAFTRRNFEIIGLKELDAALKELPQATSRILVMRILKREGETIRSAAAQLAPDDPKTHGNDLHTSMLMLATPGKAREADVEVSIGPSKKTFYGTFQEFGTAHNAAQPFLRPAWDGNVMSVLDGIANGLRDAIETIRKKVARKAESEALKIK
jgi:HK97 gp10 family phage protein